MEDLKASDFGAFVMSRFVLIDPEVPFPLKSV